MTMTFTIPCKLPSLNEVINENRRNPYAGAKQKRELQDLIGLYIMQAKGNKTVWATDKPVIIHFRWHEKTRRRDADNVASAKKFILDALQEQHILPNDNRKYVKGFTDEIVDAPNYFVEVEIEEIE